MRRLLAIVLLAAALPAVLLFGIGAEGGGEGYRVRAVFDYVRLEPGEDVKIAGAKVGVVDSLDVTADNKAAVVLDIQTTGFTPFHADARCSIRPQSLIGETFVECDPGTAAAPELPEDPDGGDGERRLPIEQTSSPIDLDLINNIMRRPYRERLAILLNEFGAGLAGRGADLNEVIHRANPALRETDRVLAILARQNDVLADLASDSDEVLTPLAAQRERVSGFIRNANQTAEATAERRVDLARSVERLPRFLAALRPTLRDLGAFADETTPLAADLRQAAPGLNRFVSQLGPFSRAAIPAIETLGETTEVGLPALERTRPLLRDLRRFGKSFGPVAKNLDALTKSLDESGGIERAMDYIFFQMTALNGFDGISHYLRAELISNLCSAYATQAVPGCSSNFSPTQVIPAGARSAKVDPHLADLRRSLRRAVRQPSAPARGDDGEQKAPDVVQRLLTPEDTRIKARREAGLKRIREGANGGRGSGDPAEPVLDYLLGGER